MVGEQQRARRVVIGYMSAQLQSGLAAMEVAMQLGDNQLFLETAKKYSILADIARQLYSDDVMHDSLAVKQSHKWGVLMQYLRHELGAEVYRQRRLPHVIGNEREQLKILQDVFLPLSANALSLTFRRRGEDLIMSCQGFVDIPKELIVAGTRQVLLSAARQPSLASIKGYLLARRCERAGMRIVVMRNTVYIHFRVMRQLRMPF